MKKLHLTRFAAVATVALMGSTAAWAASGASASDGTLTLQSNSTVDLVSISDEDAAGWNSGDGVKNITVKRGAASTPFSTLMLPAEAEASQCLQIKDAYVPTGYIVSEQTLEFTKASTIEANKPYLVEVNTTKENYVGDNITEFTFSKDGRYTIQPTGANKHSITLNNSCWEFTGVYEKQHWDTAPANVYGYAGSGDYAGKFVKVAANVTLRPLRAYLTCRNSGLKKSSTGDVSNNLPDVINVRLYGKSGETLAIGTMNTKTGEIQMQDRYYDLKGRKLNGKPQNKIMYVNKKVIKH